MAAYAWEGAEQTVYAIGETIVRPAQLVIARALASGVVFEEIFHPYPSDPVTGDVVWTPAAIDARLSDLAGWWNANRAVAGVTDIGMTQEISPLGQLFYVALVALASTSGKTTTVVTLHSMDFLPDAFAARVAAVRDELDAAEAGGAG